MKKPNLRFLDLAALTLAAAILTGSLASMGINVDPGIHLAYRDGQVVIASIDYASRAWDLPYGLSAGDVVVWLDSEDLTIQSPQEKQLIVDESWHWTSIATLANVTETLDDDPDGSGIAIENTPPAAQWWSLARYDGEGDLFPIVLGLAILGLGWWWLSRGRGGRGLERYAVTLPVAVAMPILVLPLNRVPTLDAVVLGSCLVACAMLPLAFDLIEGVPDGWWRRWGLWAFALGLAGAASLAGILLPLDTQQGSGSHFDSILRALGVAAIPIVPGILAARPMNWLNSAPDDEHSGIFASPEILVAALTPGVAAISLIPLGTFFPWPIISWLAVIVVARQLRRPATRQAARATHQRDLVVAATEAERARIAADVHDDALQDLTMLVRRLDAAGDTANAQAAREIAERLRAIVGDLRLPVLDDLGVGPSLEWLCDRLDSPAGSITLDRLQAESRQPADVELAVFRIAQEALSNALRHGKPPIIVRYVTGSDWVELEIDDSGSGVPAGAAEIAEQTGHMGLMNMAQRAEAIGGSLKIGRRPGGGTRVALVWEKAGAPDAATTPAPA